MSQEINLNDKLQKEVRIGVALLFVILYGRKRLELKKQGLQGGKLMNLIFDHWKVSLSVFIIICIISFFM